LKRLCSDGVELVAATLIVRRDGLVTELHVDLAVNFGFLRDRSYLGIICVKSPRLVHP
jgi:hypothetical protein